MSAADTEALTALADRLTDRTCWNVEDNDGLPCPEAWTDPRGWCLPCHAHSAAAVLRALPALIEAGDDIVEFRTATGRRPAARKLWREVRAALLGAHKKGYDND